MAFFALLLQASRSKTIAPKWLSIHPVISQITRLKNPSIYGCLAAAVAFYSGYAGAEILPTDTAETQVNIINAVPVVDIARPTSSGVSKNQFDDFDVDSAGVVINNSLVDGTSNLAGDLNANANFDKKSARIILNEVVTTNTSDIDGMTEIFGDDASYILSNPNGISCNGCGFIRTPSAPDDSGTSLSEVMFTTGTAAVDNGNIPLTITVDSNSSASIVIGPGGLDASRVDVTSLFTRKAQIQGVIDAARELRLLAGSGTIEIENNVAPENRILTTTQSNDGAVRVAIDASVAGAMNAGQIFIQATEDGVGVTLDNDLISTSGDIEITAEGEIRYKNASASGDIKISANGAGFDILGGGDSTAAGDIRWNMGGNGMLDAAGGIVFSAGGVLDFNCSDPPCQLIGKNNIRLDAGSLRTNAAVTTSAGNDLTINAGRVNANDITSGDNLYINASAGNIKAARITAVNNIDLVTDQVGARLEAGGITASNGNINWGLNSSAQLVSTGALTAGSNILFDCTPLLSCEINASTDLKLNAQQLITQADINTRAGRDITINASLDTDAGINSGGRLVINAQNGDISARGLLRAGQDIELSSAANYRLILDGGVISGGDLGIFGGGTYIHNGVGLFDIGGEWVVDTFGLTNNASLTITDFRDRTFFVKQLDNNGLIQSNSSLELHVDERLNNSGVITSLEGVIQVKHSQAGMLTTEVNNSGIISSTNLSQNQQPDSSLIIDPQSLIDAHIAAILDGGQLSAQDLSDSIESTNSHAIADLTVDTNILGAVEIHAQTLNNASGGSISGSQILLEVQQVVNSGGLIVAGNNLSIDGDSLTNQNDVGQFGIIAAHDNIDIKLTGQLTNTGIIEATDVQIDAPTQINSNSGIVVDPLTGQTLDSQNMVEAIGQLAWFSAGSGPEPYYQTIQVDGANPLIDSNLSRLTDAFLAGTGANLAGVPIVGDDVYLAELVAHTIRNSGGLPFVTEDRSNLLQLGTLYNNTLAFMAQSGLAFGETPTSQQLQQLEAPVIVFNQQALANNQVVYSPKLIMPQTGLNSNRLAAQQLFTQIIAYNELLLRSERVTNSASLVGGNRLVIETIDLTQTTTERNWYVDADGQVQYLSARIESPELVLSLSGDYVQQGGQIVSQGQVYLEAQTVEVRGVEVNGRSATAEINTGDALIMLAHDRARYSRDAFLSSGDQVVIQAGSDLHFGGRLKAGGDINLRAKGQIKLTAADILASSQTAGISTDGNIFARTEGDFINEGNLKAGGSIAIAARDITNTRLYRKLEDLKSSNRAPGKSYVRSITLTSGRREILDTGKFDAAGDIILIAERDIIDTAGRYYAGGDISLLAKRDIKQEAISWQETDKLSEVYTRKKERGKSGEEYTLTYRYDIGSNKRNESVTGSLIALGSVNIRADQDVILDGTDIEAASNIALSGRDITLQAVETGSEKYRSIGRTITRSKTVRHQVAELDAGGSISIQAERNLTTYGSQLNASDEENGNIFINAKGETQLRGVNNEDYSFYQHTRKKSFGRRKTWISEDRQLTLEETELSGGGSLLINLGVDANGDLAGLDSAKVVLEGATVNMGGDAMLYSADNLNILSGIEYEYHRREQHKRGAFGVNKSGNVSKEERQRLGHAEINTGGDTVLLSAGDINVVAGHLNAENIVAESGFGVEDEVSRKTNINILGDKETLAIFEHRYKRGLDFSIDDNFISLAEETHNKNWEIEQNYLGSVLNARNDINLQTQGNIEIIGSELKAGANLTLSANDISILAARDYYLDKQEKTISRIGVEIKTSSNSVDAFAGLETKSIIDEYTRDAVHGSVLSAGNRIDIEASGSILQRSGELVAGNDVILRAGGDIEVEVDHTIETYNYEETTTRTGISAGLTHNYGSTKASIESIGQGDNNISNVSNALQSIDAVDSFVSGPSVSGFAGVTSTTTRTQDTISTAQSAGVVSGGEIRFVANNSLNLTGTWVSAEDNINLSASDIVIRAAENVSIQASDFRTSNFGLSLQANKNSGSVGLGGSFTEQDIDSVSGTIQASMLRSGASISLNAIQDIGVTATDIETGENLDLVAGHDVYLGAQASTSNYQLDGRNGGAEYGFGYSETSIGLYGSVHLGEEDLLRRGTTYRNSELYVGQRLTVRSGEDTTLKGVVAEAENVDVKTGGDLTLASIQDTGSADGSRSDANLRVTGGVGVSASGSIGKGSTEGTKAWVNQQTRLTGRDSLSATVGGHTQLDGAVLAADNGNLSLDTGTLGFSNINDIEREKSDYLSIGFSLSGEQGSNPVQQQNNQATNLPLASGQQADGSGGVGLTVSGYSSNLDRAQINLATLGKGVVRVRQDEQTGIDSLANINRDVSSAQQVTRDNSSNTNFYLSDSSLNSLGGMFTLSSGDDSNAGKKNTFVRWADDMGNYARSTYFAYRKMDELRKVESDNAVISAFAKAAIVHIDTANFVGTWTGGLFPGVENNGGLYGEMPALVLGDQIFYRVRAPLIEDANGKLIVDEDNMVNLGQVDRPEENDYVYTNGIQNDLNEAILKGAMQTGAVEFIMAYNPEHGFLGDVVETGWDMYLGGLVMSGNARQLRGFYIAGIKAKSSFNIAAHSQGGIMNYRAMYGLDFSNDGDIDTGTVLFSGAPVDSQDFYDMAGKANFLVDKNIYDSNAVFQVNRPEGVTSFFGNQMVDPISDMPILMGGNGSFKESLLSLPYVIFDLGKESPHSDYLCQGRTCAGAVNRQSFLDPARNNYSKPILLAPPY